MNQHRGYSFVNVLLPSVTGIATYIAISLLTLILQTLSFFQHVINLPSSSQVGSYLLTQLDTALLFLLGTSITNIVVLGLFWAVVGLVVYFALHGVVSFFSELSVDVQDEKYIQPSGARPNSELRGRLERGALSFAMAIAAMVYVFTVLWYFLRAGGQSIASLERGTVEHSLLMFIGECAALHGFVVLLRLAFLRTRLMG